jgi:nucleotide-binding universal stress UspA family protein
MIRIKKILTPTDFSDYSSVATEYARELALKFAAELHFLHVLEVHASSTPTFGGGLAISSLIKESKDKSDEALAELAGETGGTCVSVEGQPFLEILRYATQNEIDLIVMGTHGRSGLDHVLLGSVAERIVRKSACPVLTIRHPRHRFVMPFDKVE